MSNPRHYIELHVPDFGPVREFYEALGFTEVRSEANGERAGYLVLKFEENTIAFWGGNESVFEHSYFARAPAETPRGIGVEIVLFVKDIESFYLRASSIARVLSPLATRPWGVKDFRMSDPFGFYLRFSEAHDVHQRP